MCGKGEKLGCCDHAVCQYFNVVRASVKILEVAVGVAVVVVVANGVVVDVVNAIFQSRAIRAETARDVYLPFWRLRSVRM